MQKIKVLDEDRVGERYPVTGSSRLSWRKGR